MEKRLTKKEMFEMIKGVCAENAEIVAFCDHEIELLGRKNSKTAPSKNQVANEGIKGAIIEALKGCENPVTITELQASNVEMASYSNQKLSALLKQLVEANLVVRVTDKKKTYFSVNAE